MPTEEEIISEIYSRCQKKLGSILKVKVIAGRKLYKADLFSKIDPYIQVKFGSEISTSTWMPEAGSNVDFNWTVSFPFDVSNDDEEPAASLELIVMDHDTLRPDDVVGKHTITHKQLISYQGEENAFEGEVELTRHGGFLTGSDKPAGFLNVRICWDKQPASEGFPIPTLHCISNHNLGGGIVRELLDGGGKFETFRTYQMNLWMVHTVFWGVEPCGWNQSYKAAQMIYAKGDPKAKIIREVIKLQHSTLYSKDMGVGAYKEFEIHGLLDFYQMLNQSTSSNNTGSSGLLGLRKKKSNPSSNDTTETTTTIADARRYTYVILADATMHFSQTGKAMAQDFLSKHALHACAQKSVVYAGEFFFDTKIQPKKPTLVIDNNSGTFAPPKEKLPYLQALLELNFGSDLPILALDRDDPDLQRYIDANGIQ